MTLCNLQEFLQLKNYTQTQIIQPQFIYFFASDFLSYHHEWTFLHLIASNNCIFIAVPSTTGYGVNSDHFKIFANVKIPRLNITIHLSLCVGDIASEIEISIYLPLLTEKINTFNVNIYCQIIVNFRKLQEHTSHHKVSTSHIFKNM